MASGIVAIRVGADQIKAFSGVGVQVTASIIGDEMHPGIQGELPGEWKVIFQKWGQVGNQLDNNDFLDPGQLGKKGCRVPAPDSDDQDLMRMAGSRAYEGWNFPCLIGRERAV